MTHTPGPWRVDKRGEVSVQGPDSFMVADCEILSIRPNAPTGERCRANARLIAAAPDMLAALRDIVLFCEEHIPRTSRAITRARSAISKAEGQHDRK